jgi:radical SAM protein with 4Fe4S-binding SPASM domain
VRPLRAPIKVTLDVTLRCLLHCQHCRVGEAVPRPALSFNEILGVVEDLARMGVFRIALSGGEPFLRDDTIEIIRHALRVSPGRVIVSTSGLAFSGDTLATLQPLRDRLTFKISLDGPPRIHDAIRRSDGAFAAAYAAIRECVRMGFTVQVTTTLMRENAGLAEEILALVEQTGCSRHYLVELIPVGRANPQMTLTRGDRLRLSQSIALARRRLGRDGYRVVARIPFSGGRAEGLTCCAGLSECGVMADGRVVGCRLLPQFVAGSVLERPLSQIWADPNAFPEFRSFTARDCSAACAACRVAESCRGGCRAYAFGTVGRFCAPDSRCPVAFRESAQNLAQAL